MITKQQRDDILAQLPEMTKAELIDTSSSLASRARSGDTKKVVVNGIMRRLEELAKHEERDRLEAMTKAELLIEASNREKYPHCIAKKSMTKAEIICEIHNGIKRQEIEREREVKRAATVAPVCPVCGGELVLMIEKKHSAFLKDIACRDLFGKVYCVRQLGHRCKPTGEYTEFELDLLATGEPCKAPPLSSSVPSVHRKCDDLFEIRKIEGAGRKVIESRYVG